jgi:sn-glycerol 3-phosphate transport system permease protein
MADPQLNGPSVGAAPGIAAKPSRLTGHLLRQVRVFAQAMLYLAPALVIFITFVFIPLGRSIRLSLYLTDPLGRPAAFAGLEQYQRLFGTPVFINSLERTLLFALYTVPTTLVLALILAVLGNFRLKRIDIFRMIFSCTIAVSAATAALIFRYLFHPALGMINYVLSLVGIAAVPWLTSADTALIAVAMVTVWLQLGLNTVILLAGMQGISDELYESAMIDGANGWDRFISITIPLLSPTLFFLLIVDMLAAFQVFTQVQVLTTGGPMDSTNVLVYSIYRSFYFNGQYGFAAAQSIMLFLIILILTVLQFGVVERKVFYS